MISGRRKIWISDGILIKGKLEGSVQYSFPKKSFQVLSGYGNCKFVLKIISSFGMS